MFQQRYLQFFINLRLLLSSLNFNGNTMGMLACLENTLPNLYLIKCWWTVGIWIFLEDFAINIKLMLFLFFFQLGYDESNLLPIKLQLVWWCDVILYVWAYAGCVSSLVSIIKKNWIVTHLLQLWKNFVDNIKCIILLEQIKPMCNVPVFL